MAQKKDGRPQNKNLIPLNKRNDAEKRAIQSAGGKASQKARREKQKIKELLELYSELPITDKRIAKRLKNLGFEEGDLSQKLLVADGIIKGAQKGNSYLIQLYLALVGEMGLTTGNEKENNLLETIQNSAKEDINVDDISELQQETDVDSDVVGEEEF